MQLDLRRDIHAMILPAIPRLELDDTLLGFLHSGGASLLFGETREEYTSRVIDPVRVAAEPPEKWRKTIETAREIAGPVLVCVDAEIGGIQRLHRLVPGLPNVREATIMASHELERISSEVAVAARRLGVNVFLSPVADVLVGPNPWLEGRTLGEDLDQVARIVAAFVKGVQRVGVAATVKHFPGHPQCPEDPAIAESTVSYSLDELRGFLAPFQAGIDAGADIVMMGPAIFEAVTPPTPASISGELIDFLRTECQFNGLVLTDDLDWKATIRSNTLEETAIAAIQAGADLMLISALSVPKIPQMVQAIELAVKQGRIKSDRVSSAARRVRALAAKLTLPV